MNFLNFLTSTAATTSVTDPVSTAVTDLSDTASSVISSASDAIGSTTTDISDVVSSTVSSVTDKAEEITSVPFLGMFFAILLIVCAIALVVVVVLQTNRGSEMSALTGRNSNAAGRGQSAKKEMLFKRLTIGLGIVFMVLAFILNILIAQGFFD